MQKIIKYWIYNDSRVNPKSRLRNIGVVFQENRETNPLRYWTGHSHY